MPIDARVLYLPPTLAGRQRTGTVQAVSGVSALVRFDDCVWPQWTPLARLLPILGIQDGWVQLCLVTVAETKEALCP